MPSNYWLKLYHELLHDPKMAQLDSDTWRRCIEMFLFAGEHGTKQGYLPSLTDMAWTLHSTPEELASDIGKLLELGILSRDEDGRAYVTQFESRQAPASAAARQKRYRERSHKAQHYGNEPRNEPVTIRNTELESDIDLDESRVEVDAKAPRPAAAAAPLPPESRPESNADPVVAHLFTLLDKAAVIVNGAMQAEAWTDLLDITRDKTLLSETFVEAARTGKHPSPNWCRSVLERCIRDNTRPGKWNGDGRARDEPAGKPYARDGPLRTILVEDSQGNTYEETI